MSEQDATLDEFESNEHTSTERVETSLGLIPADWEVESLDDICSINPDGFSEDDWPEPTFEYIDLSNVSEGEILQSETTPVDDAPSRAQRQVKQGDVLVGTVRPKQVSHGFVTEEHGGKICSSGFGVLRTPSNLHPIYLLQEVLSHRFFRQMEAYVAGSGYPAVKIGDLRKHRIAIPPLEEQRKIASVLYTVDKAVEKTEKIIEQTKRYKSGLKQDLFRKGVREGSTKQVPTIGEIPEYWRVETIGDMSEWVTDGTHTPYDAQQEGYPCLTGKNIRDYGFKLDDVKKVSKEAFEEMRSRVCPKQDDVLFVKDGSIGYTQVNNLDFDFGILESVLLIRVDKDKIRPHYLQQLLTWDPFRELLISRRVGTGIERMTISGMEKAEIIVPPIDEQKEIEEILLEVDDYIDNEVGYLDQLKRLKEGLMQDLLSGDVRTHDKDIEVMDDVLQYG